MINFAVRALRGLPRNARFFVIMAIMAAIFGAIVDSFSFALAFYVMPMLILVAAITVWMPTASSAYVLWLYARSNTPFRMVVQPSPPTAADWNRCVVSFTGLYALLMGSLWLLNFGFARNVLVSAIMMTFYVLAAVIVPLAADSLFWLADRRHWRREQAEIVRLRALEDARNAQRAREENFWGVIRENYPKPGAEGVA